ncbi:MAG: cysteate synthase [Candidatus Eremiobacteraeota bacterium]|nr:cysteate synthase [Candidatus Eremiobacteraeota bacterium]
MAYVLRCTGCGSEHDDDGLRVQCGTAHAPSMLRTLYSERTFAPDPHATGILRYRNWLPIRNAVPAAPRTVTFQSDSLNRALQTPNLWIAFNGFWPARNAHFLTATFKELEAHAVVARFPRDGTVLVAPSAGNTAVALAAACSAARIPALIVVPDGAIPGLRFPVAPGERVKFVAVRDGTYDDAISIARQIATIDGFEFEGGAANVARRDGIGTTMLASVEAMGCLPDYYVQAIGSGSGAIAAHEASLRLVGDGRFGMTLPRLFLVQNSPSSPVDASWKKRSPLLLGIDDDRAARAAVAQLSAKVLGIRIPPYSLAGGLFSILTESGGETTAVSNEAARAAAALFETSEGIDIEPAAAVALAGLQSGLADGRIPHTSMILLHVTGGGRRVSLAHRPHSATPCLVVPHCPDERDGAAANATRLFSAA